jgi:hypothetical protein
MKNTYKKKNKEHGWKSHEKQQSYMNFWPYTPLIYDHPKSWQLFRIPGLWYTYLWLSNDVFKDPVPIISITSCHVMVDVPTMMLGWGVMMFMWPFHRNFRCLGDCSMILLSDIYIDDLKMVILSGIQILKRLFVSQVSRWRVNDSCFRYLDDKKMVIVSGVQMRG